MIFFLMTSNAFSQTLAMPATAVKSAIQTSKTQIKKPKSLLALSPWSLTTDYTASTNMADERFNKTSEHTLDAEIDYSFGRFLNGECGVSIATGLISYADGNNIRNDGNNPIWNDLSLGFSYGQRTWANSKIVFSINENLPTGYESQSEGYKSVVETNAALATPIFIKSLTLTNTMGMAYIVNSFSDSPNSLASNPNYVSSYKLGLSFRLPAGFSVGAVGILKSVHFMNDENQLRSSTSEYIQYKAKVWSISLAYLMGNYDENDTYRFLYLDENRRVFRLGVKLEI